MDSLKIKLISCEIFFREMCFASSQSVNQIDLEFLPKGLHDVETEKMTSTIQGKIDECEGKGYDYIALGYALCNNGVSGLRSRTIPLIIPRAHDCITLFLGNKEKYQEYFDNNPGSYFLTSGWIERNENSEELEQFSIQEQIGMNKSYEEMVEEYGEDNAQFLYETLCSQTKNYEQFTYISMGLGPEEKFEKFARKEADINGWKFDRVAGSMKLIKGLVDGEWDYKNYLIIKPGGEITPSYDETIICCNYPSK